MRLLHTGKSAWRFIDFNPRTPCGVRPPHTGELVHPLHISIHAPRVGCDMCIKSPHENNKYFNPRTPCGVRPGFLLAPMLRAEYFNPRTPCGVRLSPPPRPLRPPRFQSTHPVWGATFNLNEQDFSNLFQSTHPVWGATSSTRVAMATPINFNPRTPCGVRHELASIIMTSDTISIHAPRVGCDQWHRSVPVIQAEFQSTHPVWGATTH